MFPGTTTKLTEAPVVASAATIKPKHDVIRLTGTTSIATIVPPPNFQAPGGGVLVLIPTAGDISLLNSGNIALAATMTSLKATILVYSVAAGKWYPNV